MNTDLLEKVAAQIRREAETRSFDMSVWFKTGVPAGARSDLEDVGHNITEASDLQDFFDRVVEGRWDGDANGLRACGSAACAAGTTLWVAMKEGERFEHDSIEANATRALDLPSGTAECIFRMTTSSGWEIAEVFDGLADGTIVWRPEVYADDAGDGDHVSEGLYFNQGNSFDGPYEPVTGSDLDRLANARRMVDRTRKELLKEKRVYRIQVEVAKAQRHLDDLKVQLQHELYPEDLVDDEPF